MRGAGPGIPRLRELNRLIRDEADFRMGTDHQILTEQPDCVEAGFEDLMEEEASNGSFLAEVRLGGVWVLRPHFLTCFRAAERRVQTRHPLFHAEPIIALGLDPPELGETIFRYTCELASEGIAGVDLYPEYRRYEYREINRMAEMAAAAGLGVTCHDGEFDPETLWQPCARTTR